MEAVIVALISLVGGVLVALIQRNRKQEKAEHGMVMQTLTRVETKIDGHIADHAKGEFQPELVQPKRKRK
ncbi:MAG: hypothetical protein EBU84_03435 [Actinobacteria bacterium]|nr:hypothetical protein [Actinomycetota bacterium]